MAYTPDKLTDKELAKLEKRIAKVYKEAEKDLNREIREYFAKFKLRDKEMQALVKAGEMTQADYQQWRLTQMGRGQRFEALRDKVAERYTNANEVANAYVNDATPSIYSLNRNYEAYNIEKNVGSCDFTMWDESTVRRLLVEQPDLMPYYPPSRALNRGIDLAYGKKQITKHVTSGIIRGLAPGKIANELMSNITTMNRESAVRAARTGITAAQNAGRMDSYVAAEKMGIQIKRRWVCTKDSRTRLDHGLADGQIVVGTKQPFIVGGYKMMFPCDTSMNAPGHEIYNCRCTTRTVEKDGIEAEPREMRVRNPQTGKWELVNEMTYSEWLEWKKGNRTKFNEPVWDIGNEEKELLQGRYKQLMAKYPTRIDAVEDLITREQKEYDTYFNKWVEKCLSENPKMRRSTAEKRAVQILGKRPDEKDMRFAFMGGRFHMEKRILVINPHNISGSQKTFLEDIEARRKHNERQARRKAKGTYKPEFDKFGNVVESIEGSFIHEYGHALDAEYKITSNKAFIDFYNEYTEKDIAYGISEYASTDIMEFFAECFTESFYSDQREISKKAMKIAEGIMNAHT